MIYYMIEPIKANPPERIFLFVKFFGIPMGNPINGLIRELKSGDGTYVTSCPRAKKATEIAFSGQCHRPKVFIETVAIKKSPVPDWRGSNYVKAAEGNKHYGGWVTGGIKTFIGFLSKAATQLTEVIVSCSDKLNPVLKKVAGFYFSHAEGLKLRNN